MLRNLLWSYLEGLKDDLHCCEVSVAVCQNTFRSAKQLSVNSSPSSPIHSTIFRNLIAYADLPIYSTIFRSGVSLMGDGPRKLDFIPDHFQASTSSPDSPQKKTTSSRHPTTDTPSRSKRHLWDQRKLRSAAAMLNMFSLRGLPWGSGTDGREKVVLSAAEVESLRSELADLEEREAHLKAQLENLDEILRSARLTGYLYIRARWKALPGEPPPIDDADVDDRIPRFVVLHGSCIFFYLVSSDLSPQDSTILSDVVEVGRLPNFKHEDEEIWYSFYILTRHGLRYECFSVSEIQVDSWLKALQIDCNLGPDKTTLNDSSGT